MHWLRDNNSTKHLASALAELPGRTRGAIFTEGLSDLGALSESSPAQNRRMKKADSWIFQDPSKIQHRNRTTTVSIEESTLDSNFCFALEEETDCPRVHEFLSALRVQQLRRGPPA